MSTKKGKAAGLSMHVASDPLMSYIAATATGKEAEWRRTTMGRMVTAPTVKLPETKGTPDIQAVASAASEKAMMATKEAEKKRLRLAAGRKSLIATSGRGVLEPAPTKKKKLLGE